MTPRQLAKKLGIKLTYSINAVNGFRFFASNNRHVCHEIAHYLLATPKQRTLPYYGLGSPFIGQKLLKDDPKIIIEYQASLLGILLMGWMNLPFISIRETLEAHEWIKFNGKETARGTIKKTIQNLQTKGFVVKNTEPTIIGALPGKRIIEVDEGFIGII